MTIFVNFSLYIVCKIYTAVRYYKGIFFVWCIYVSLVWYFDLFYVGIENELKSKIIRVAIGSLVIFTLYVVLGIASAISDILSNSHIRKGLSSKYFGAYSEAMKIYYKKTSM